MLALTINDLLSPPVMMAAGLTAMVWVVVRMRRRGMAARPKTPSAPVRETNSAPTSADARAVAGEFHALLAEVNETSRRIAAQLDNRYMRLEQLLADADARIKRLEELTGHAGKAAESAAAPPAAVGGEARGELPDPRHRKIYDLADRGHSAREIAQLANCPPGEVELILNLRRKTEARG